MSRMIPLYRNKLYLREKNISEWGLFEYNNEDDISIITINKNLPIEDKVSTFFHELSHYVVGSWVEKSSISNNINKLESVEESISEVVEVVIQNALINIDWFLDGIVLLKTKKKYKGDIRNEKKRCKEVSKG